MKNIFVFGFLISFLPVVFAQSKADDSISKYKAIELKMLDRENKFNQTQLQQKEFENTAKTNAINILESENKLKDAQVLLKEAEADKKSKELNLVNTKNELLNKNNELLNKNNELLNKDNQIREAEILKQKQMRNIFVVGLLVMLVFTGFVVRSLRNRNKQNKIILEQKHIVEREKHRSEQLLLNILPADVAEELKQTGTAKAKTFKEVTVIFTDFKDFSSIAEKMEPEDLVDQLHYCFTKFDKLSQKFGLEKIKTIGDSYMAVAGLPRVSEENAVDAVRAGLAIRNFMDKYNEKQISENKQPFEIRIGIHSGPVTAGIVGVKKFAYDIWGDTVNTASRMESSGEIGKVNISENTYKLVKNYFECTYRGELPAKNKGVIGMYFVERKI